ncbi:hypothetical protein BS17DRAFT_718205, partial [Gyrodon lividus]
KKFLAHCNLIWTSNGILVSTAHSFRISGISGITELLLAGIPPDIVKASGCWSSDTFLCYWCSLELLAPLYI